MNLDKTIPQDIINSKDGNFFNNEDKIELPPKPLGGAVEIMNILIDYMKNNSEYDTYNRG